MLIQGRREIVRLRSHSQASVRRHAGCSALGARIGSYVVRKLESLRERHRMMRIRRNPTPLVALLRSARRMLIVCHGNIIRSPFAARLMAQILVARAPIAIASAGVQASPNRPPDPAAVAAASQLGVDLRDHVAVRITPEIVARADVILVMDVSQLLLMRKCFPNARGRTFLMAALCRDVPLEIADPFGGNAATFQECYGHVSRAVYAIVRVIAGEKMAGTDRPVAGR